MRVHRMRQRAQLIKRVMAVALPARENAPHENRAFLNDGGLTLSTTLFHATSVAGKRTLREKEVCV